MIKKITIQLVILLLIGTSVLSAAETPEKIQDTANELRFDLKIKILMKFGHMPSLTACIIKNNTISWSKSYGYKNIYLLKKAKIDSIYGIGSITKSLTATAIMQLWEKGCFDLDDDINEYLDFSVKNPNFPDIPITFRMLLSHQSSLFEQFKFSSLIILFSKHSYSWLKEVLVPGGDSYNPEFWMNYPPGAEANYSNFGFILLGYLIERITNQSFEEYCQENIFTPLNMINTGFNHEEFNRRKLATPYARLAGFYVPLPHYDFNFLFPAGGIRTTVEDLSHFLIAHTNGGIYNDNRILTNSTVELMHTHQYPNNEWNGYKFGLGWATWTDDDGEIYEGYSGGAPGYGAMLKIRKSDNSGIIYFTNSYRGFKTRFERRCHSLLNDLLFQKV